MRLLRSWPAQVPPGRNYVNDQIERLIINGYRYDHALDEIGDDVLLLEWDIAVGPEDLATFAEFARADPNRVAVAPYRLYVTTVNSQPLPSPKWVHRYDTNTHVQENDPFCHWFGLGMTYLPRELVQAFTVELRYMQERFNQWTEGFNDCSFSMWHWRVIKQQVPICWDVRPVHLHYQLPSP